MNCVGIRMYGNARITVTETFLNCYLQLAIAIPVV